MDTAPYAVALSAGILAAVNPCGFAMLPAYVSLLVAGDTGTKAGRTWLSRLGRALALTGAMTLGFAAFFGGFGLLAAPAADWLAARLPWLTIAIGLILLASGMWLLTGRDLPSPVPKTASAPALSQRFWPMFAFGVSFAVASLGCTIGPFLAVVVASFTTGSPAAGAGLFLAYAAGMALIVGTVSVAAATAEHAVIRWLRRFARVVSRLAGGFMAAAGMYVAWYGWYEIRVFNGSITADPLIDSAARLQSWLADAAGQVSAPLLIAAVAVVLILAAALTRPSRRRGNRKHVTWMRRSTPLDGENDTDDENRAAL